MKALADDVPRRYVQAFLLEKKIARATRNNLISARTCPQRLHGEVLRTTLPQYLCLKNADYEKFGNGFRQVRLHAELAGSDGVSRDMPCQTTVEQVRPSPTHGTSECEHGGSCQCYWRFSADACSRPWLNGLPC